MRGTARPGLCEVKNELCPGLLGVELPGDTWLLFCRFSACMDSIKL